MSSPQQPPNGSSESHGSVLRDVWHKVNLVSTLLTFVTLGVQGGVMEWMADKVAPAATIWNVLATTAPLAISVTLLGRGLLSGWFETPAHFLAGAVVVLGLSAFVAASCGMPSGSADQWGGIFRPGPGDRPAGLMSALLTAFDRALGIYWGIYGARMFFSSLLVGAFLTWLWGRVDGKDPQR